MKSGMMARFNLSSLQPAYIQLLNSQLSLSCKQGQHDTDHQWQDHVKGAAFPETVFHSQALLFAIELCNVSDACFESERIRTWTSSLIQTFVPCRSRLTTKKKSRILDAKVASAKLARLSAKCSWSPVLNCVVSVQENIFPFVQLLYILVSTGLSRKTSL